MDDRGMDAVGFAFQITQLLLSKKRWVVFSCTSLVRLLYVSCMPLVCLLYTACLLYVSRVFFVCLSCMSPAWLLSFFLSFFLS